jgi:hypothetical protein
MSKVKLSRLRHPGMLQQLHSNTKPGMLQPAFANTINADICVCTDSGADTYCFLLALSAAVLPTIYDDVSAQHSNAVTPSQHTPPDAAMSGNIYC